MGSGATAALVPAGVLFVACAYFTRAPTGRIAAAVLGGLLAGGLNLLADIGAHELGWWSYPITAGRAFGPLGWYGAAALGVAGLTLIGWRAHRRFGLAGLLMFLVAFAAYGTLRDEVISRVTPAAIRFGVGAAPRIADFATWLVCTAAAVAVQRAFRGPPGRDVPHRRPSRSAPGR
jgi:hypothetical protein